MRFAALIVLAASAGIACASDRGLEASPTTPSPADPAALVELALKFEHAEGVARDLPKAAQLYCLSAKQGDAEAQFRLGWLYAHGRGVNRDDDIAAALFDLAARQGHLYAARMLRFVHNEDGTQLPACMAPEPAPTKEVAAMPPARADIGDVQGGGIERLVRHLAPEYAVDPRLVLAVISVESAFNPNAISPKKAQGLMQLMPGTAERFGVKQLFDPVENIRGGMAYLRWLLAFFEGDVPLVLAAYNAGERAVERFRGIPPYAETRAYVRRISGIYGKTTHPFEPGTAEPSPLLFRMKRGPT